MIRDQADERTSTAQLREGFLLEGAGLAIQKSIVLARQVEESQREAPPIASTTNGVDQVRKGVTKHNTTISSKEQNTPDRRATSSQHCWRCAIAKNLETLLPAKLGNKDVMPFRKLNISVLTAILETSNVK